MKTTLHQYFLVATEDLKTAGQNDWLLKWPAQIVITISQVVYTTDVTEAIQEIAKPIRVRKSVHENIKGVSHRSIVAKGNALETLYQNQNTKLLSIVELIKGSFSRKDTLTLEVLIVIEVHNLDSIQELIDSRVRDVSAFEWASQLRYYYEKKNLWVQMVNTNRVYGWEYLGNQGRLVITPLTDRCYRTLMSALQMYLGGAPEGPAGTGKTETTKDLGKAMAKYCFVFNCSDDLDITQMNKFFKGLCMTGSWACFDEFNRIELEVLSVIAQQIFSIQTSILKETERRHPLGTFDFEGTTMPLDMSTAIFITMNPGYAGRSELPDNLKRLFRTMAMMVPDFALIARISLYSYGYVKAKELATKIVYSLKLSNEQLSTQSHYDFGMRSVKAILVACGNLKRSNPDENEARLVMRAICDCTVPKFTSEDIPLFESIIKDLFPKETMLEFPNENMDLGILKSAQELNIQLPQLFRNKITQLFETIQVRHGLMVVGEAFSGKSKLLQVLKDGWQLSYKIEIYKEFKEKELNSRYKCLIDQKKTIDLDSLDSLNCSCHNGRWTAKSKVFDEDGEEETSNLRGLDSIKRGSTTGNNPRAPQRPNPKSPPNDDPRLLPTSDDSVEAEDDQTNQIDWDDIPEAHLKVMETWMSCELRKIKVSELESEIKARLIKIDRIFPKAVSSAVLYGECDDASGDWIEGIVAKIFKEASGDETDALRWIIFDGPVDAGWIENMNTVLDDNKKLCLANSDQIKLSEYMSIIFQVEDLLEASLATVSRCGMVYMEPKQLDPKMLLHNWVDSLPFFYQTEEHRSYYLLLYDKMFLPGLKIFRDSQDIKSIMEVTDHFLVTSFLK
jgi:hypothetical protein